MSTQTYDTFKVNARLCDSWRTGFGIKGIAASFKYVEYVKLSMLDDDPDLDITRELISEQIHWLLGVEGNERWDADDINDEVQYLKKIKPYHWRKCDVDCRQRSVRSLGVFI